MLCLVGALCLPLLVGSIAPWQVPYSKLLLCLLLLLLRYLLLVLLRSSALPAPGNVLRAPAGH
jgi:hypothetical protein